MQHLSIRTIVAVAAAMLAGFFSASSARAQSPIYDWTGFYAGVHGGYTSSKTVGMDLFESTQQSLRGGFFGGQFGYNQQFGRVVWGGELSGSYGNITGSGNCFPGDPFPDFCKTKQDWSAAFLTRLGYAIGDGRFLPYLTGGVTLGRFGLKKTIVDLFLPPEHFSTQHVQFGGTFGGGFQYALGSGYFLGLEYSFTRFFNQDHSNTGDCGCFDIANQNLTTQSIKLSLNYTFASPPPLVQGSSTPSTGASTAYDWTGFYVGGHVGRQSMINQASTLGVLTVIEGSARQSDAATIGGGQIGYNRQFGQFVLGAEFSASSGSSGTNSFCFDASPSTNCRASQDWSALFLTRLGYAYGDGRFLPYVTGGVALSRVNVRYDDSSFPIDWEKSKQMVGGVLGAGFQYAAGSGISYGLEYLYTRYGTQDFGALLNGFPIPFVPNNFNVITDQTLRFVANYKFGDSTAPNERSPKAVYDWSGLYIGLNGGGNWSRATGTDQTVLILAGFPSADLTDQKIRGAFGGGQIGFTQQYGRAVFGTEFSASFGNTEGKSVCFEIAGLAVGPGFDLSCRLKQNWSAQYVTRLGYAFGDGRILPYLIGGIALTELQSTRTYNDMLTPFFAQWSDSQLHVGAVFGAGFQYALQNNLSIGAEYLRTQYGMQEYTSQVGGFPAVFSQDLTTNVFRVVLNYKFDGASAGR